MRMTRRRGARRLSGQIATLLALAASVLGSGLVIPVGLAHADVTSSHYTIGTPSPPVSSVVVSPSKVAADTSTNFVISFTAEAPLAGSAGDWVTVTPSKSLGSTPTVVALVGSSCIQSGTNGGAYSATGVTINLDGSCSSAAGTEVEVDFTVNAPVEIGTLTFTVSTSENETPATSNDVTVATPGPMLSAMSYAFGVNTTYTIGEAPVANLTSGASTLTLSAAATVGTETIAFANGAAGYTVMYTPSGGSPTSDTVDAAASSGATVTLTLATPLTDGDTIAITAPGLNPAASGASQADHVTVEPGNGSAETTNAIDFGGSVSDVGVTPAFAVATAATTYTVDFHASDAAPMGGYIYLTEAAGPTGFETTTGIEVTDETQSWHFTATGAVLSNGSATIPLQDAITAGDSLSISIANVTNPAAAGTINDFTVATSADPVATAAPAYAIEANGSPGVVVSVDPSATGATATYTLSNVFAAATITGGAGTIKLEAPAGTVFPNSPSLYSIADATTSSGSGTVTAALSGGGTNVVTFTVPNSINSGDALTLIVSDVRNPSTASPADSITLVGSVTGPPPIALPTTTTTPVSPSTTQPTTTTTSTATTTPTTAQTPRRPIVSELAARARLRRKTVGLTLRCTAAACKGAVTLTHERIALATVKYAIRAGKTATVTLHVGPKLLRLLAVAKHHTITVTATITVSGGKTIKAKVTLVG
jgi:hypothetical protein